MNVCVVLLLNLPTPSYDLYLVTWYSETPSVLLFDTWYNCMLVKQTTECSLGVWFRVSTMLSTTITTTPCESCKDNSVVSIAIIINACSSVDSQQSHTIHKWHFVKNTNDPNTNIPKNQIHIIICKMTCQITKKCRNQE